MLLTETDAIALKRARARLAVGMLGGCSFIAALIALIGGTFLWKVGRVRIETGQAIKLNITKFLGDVHKHRYADAAALLMSPDAAGIESRETALENRLGPLLDWKLTGTRQETTQRDHVDEGRGIITYRLRYTRGEADAVFTFESKDPLLPETRIAAYKLGDATPAPLSKPANP